MSKKILLGGMMGVLLLTPLILRAEEAGFPIEEEEGHVVEADDTVKLKNPLGNIESFPQLIKAVLDAAFIIGLPIAVLFIVLAGFRFIWARGNSSQLEKAKHNLLYTVVGIAVFFGAWTLAKIIESTIKALGVGS